MKLEFEKRLKFLNERLIYLENRLKEITVDFQIGFIKGEIFTIESEIVFLENLLEKF